jgi:nucleoside-diphosphate-sugar epimerase
MKIVIAGGNGQIARRLGRMLAARGDRVIGIVRNPARNSDLQADGMEPVVCDLERHRPTRFPGLYPGRMPLSSPQEPGLAAERPASTQWTIRPLSC